MLELCHRTLLQKNLDEGKSVTQLVDQVIMSLIRYSGAFWALFHFQQQLLSHINSFLHSAHKIFAKFTS